MAALYKEISNQILEQIASGERKVGDRLPPEVVFASELGISRATLRSAFNDLESSGVLLRRKRMGTQIIAENRQPQFQVAGDSAMELLQFFRDSAMQVERVSTVRAVDVEVLREHIGKSIYWLEIIGSRAVDDESKPICTNCVYVPEYFSDIAHVLESDTSALMAIEKKYGVKVGRITAISKSTSCTERDANIIGLDTGAPVLHSIAEFYDQDGKLMEIVVSNFDSERFQIHSNLVIQ